MIANRIKQLGRNGTAPSEIANPHFCKVVSTIKIELFADSIPDGKEQVDRELFDYIEIFYNRIRLHSTLGYITPAERELQALQESLAA